MRAISSTLLLVPLLACATGEGTVQRRADGSMEVFGGRVIPAMPVLLGMREQYELRRPARPVQRGHHPRRH